MGPPPKKKPPAGAIVALVTPETATTDPEDVDLAGLAATTVRIRAEVRKPLG
ncbi:hypothetical protein [Streptomyces litmocidini]|uniref:hypothetical protein n=1 Tax=Streptomyces litmocidini TaxID=67318 RepID=UPI00167EE2CE|nr:hypothetical protein [Streptomyces litmocidini]